MCDANLVLEIRLSCQSPAETHKLVNVLWHSVCNNHRHIRAGPVEGCSIQLHPTPGQPIQPAVIICSFLSITRRVTGCRTDEGLLQGAVPGSPSSLAPQELAVVSDIQGRSPHTDFGPRERLWAPRHRAALGSRFARPQSAQLGRGIARALGSVTSPPASITGVPGPALAVCLRHSLSKNILATPAGGSCLQSSTRHQGYNGRNLVIPSASHACSLAGRDLACTTGQFRSPTPPLPWPYASFSVTSA